MTIRQFVQLSVEIKILTRVQIYSNRQYLLYGYSDNNDQLQCNASLRPVPKMRPYNAMLIMSLVRITASTCSPKCQLKLPKMANHHITMMCNRPNVFFLTHTFLYCINFSNNLHHSMKLNLCCYFLTWPQ